jgi:GDP-4-dehydro-6-deoxy-D-mannose reductase
VRAFVTGGHGFVGPWLLEHLADCGDDVEASESIDVTDPDGLRSAMLAAHPDAVYHLAAQSSVGSSWSGQAVTFEVNATGTLHVLEAAQACSPQPRVLVVSSAEVYGAVPTDELPVKETAPFRPATPYAASKAAAELLGLQAFLGAGLDVVRVRPFNHTGPGQLAKFVIPALARQVAEAAKSGTTVLQTGNLHVLRDVTDVRDVVRAYRLLVESAVAGEVYNVCRGESVSVADLAQRLIALAGVDLEVRVDPDRVRPVDVPEMRGDPGRIQALGWCPRIGLDHMLLDVFQYWQSAGPEEA